MRRGRSVPIAAALLAASMGAPAVDAFVAPQVAVSSRRSLTRQFVRFDFKSDTKEETEITSAPTKFDPFQLQKRTANDHRIEVGPKKSLIPPPTEQDGDGEIGIWAARGLLLLVAAIWATNFASVKYLSDLCFHPPCNHPPSEFAFARFGIAALVSLPLLLNQRKDVVLAGLECGLSITLGYVTQSLALETISAGKCAFICSLTVVFVPIIGALLYGKPIKPMNIVAASIALLGVGVLEEVVDFNELLGIPPAIADATSMAADASSALASSSIETANAAAGPIASLAQTLGVERGDIIALGQPLGFGYSFLRIEHFQEKYKDVPNRVLTIAAAQCVSVGFLSYLWFMNDYNWEFPDMHYLLEPHRVVTLLWTGIVTTVFAIYLEGIALQKATATDAAISFSSEPVWASIFGFLLLHEQLGLNAYIGGAIIMSACLVGALSDLPGDEDENVIDVTANDDEMGI